jgi:flagellar basal-body rod modification protein FlgD
MVTSVTDTAATAATSSTLASQQKKLADNFDTFLTLLTAQLKNQNPLEPMKSEEFTQQLVQYSGIEQQIESNKLLNKLVSASGADGVTAAVSYIGKTVSVSGDTQTLKNASASWGYSLPREATNVEIAVQDRLGRTVATVTGEGGAGNHTFAWDGKDAQGRQLVDGGAYTLKVTAKDSAGTSMTPTVSISGRVRAIESGTDGPVLVLDQTKAALSKVTSVAEAS